MFEDYNEYMESQLWQAKRDLIFKRDNYKCIHCSSTEDLRCHHGEYPKELGTESTYTLFTLCNKCHIQYHEQYGKKPTVESTIEFIESTFKKVTKEELCEYGKYMNKELYKAEVNGAPQNSYNKIYDAYNLIYTWLVHGDISINEAMKNETYIRTLEMLENPEDDEMQRIEDEEQDWSDFYEREGADAKQYNEYNGYN